MSDASGAVVPARVADTEPAPPLELSEATVWRMLCDACQEQGRYEIKLKGRRTICEECGDVTTCFSAARAELELADEQPTQPEIGAVAGIIRIPGEELFDALESEEDIVNANRELLEGRPLTLAESERWTRLFHEVMHECNKRLAVKGIVLLAAVPEPNGLGGVLTGCDRASLDAASRNIAMPSEDYVVTVTLPARERVDIARSEREEFARGLINAVCSECIEQQAAYRAKQRQN